MNALSRVSERFVRLIHDLSAILLAVASALVVYQVVTRFVIGDSATWTEVLARAVIIWMVFLVCGPAIRLGRMIPIDVLRGMLPVRMQIWLVRFVFVATLVVLAVLIWFGFRMTLRVMDQQVAMLNVSMAWFYAAIPVGSTLALPGVVLSLLDAETEHREAIEDLS
jgi:TRAP-type C4-dicarboxylate transport system permease small subunit